MKLFCHSVMTNNTYKCNSICSYAFAVGHAVMVIKYNSCSKTYDKYNFWSEYIKRNRFDGEFKFKLFVYQCVT